MEKQRGFAILHLRFAIQDAFFSILLMFVAGRAGVQCGRRQRWI
jgi:hypothetical protein